jgi:TPR repeat protein
MKHDELPPRKRAVVSSSRPIPPAEVPIGGPLRQLKELLHSLYVEAGTPVLDDIVTWIEAQYAAELVPSVPSRDTVRDCLGSPDLPARQSDAITIAGTLASCGRRNPEDAKDQARQLWAAAYGWAPLGRLIIKLDDPFALEVHRAIEAAPGHIGLSVLPPYLERDHDHQLRQRIRKVVEGRSTMVVLVGGSSTGKTRACWEAIHTLPAGWRLWHPFDPTRPEAALETLEQVGPQTVVWLNETQHYLLTSPEELGERVAARLRGLLRDPRRGPVLVLGTIWPEYWDILTRDQAVWAKDSHAQARALLTGTDIGVPDAFTGSALTALRAAADADPRLAQAQTDAQDGQITQFLAGVPALLERYRNAPATAKALIEAAMDARRLGHSLALPHSLLEAAVPGYLTDQQWDTLGEDWLEQALAYTAAPCRGIRGPLTRIRPRPGQSAAEGPHYRLSDYLEQHGRTIRRARCTTTTLWDALVAHATREDLAKLGSHAQRRRLYRYAFQLYQAADEAGDPSALHAAVRLLDETGRTDEAITYFQRAAETGNPFTLWKMARLLEELGRTDEAITYFQRAAEVGDPLALRAAARLLDKAGRTYEAITWLQARAEANNPDALRAAADLLGEAGRSDEAIIYFQRAAEAGNPFTLREAARLLEELGRTDEAITYFQRAAEVGDPFALRAAARLLDKAGRTYEAITWLQARAEANNPDALREAAHLLDKAGRTDEAITWLQARAEAGGPFTLRAAARLLEELGRTDEAITYFQRAAEAGNPDALRAAARLLEELGRTDEAITWLQARAKANNPDALREAARLLEELGRTDEAITWLQARAKANNPDALREAARLLDKAGRTDEAITYFQRAAETGNPDALREAARLLDKAGRTDEAITYFQRAAETGNPDALRRAARLLDKAGRTDEAITYFQRAAETGNPDALREAADLSYKAGRTDEAITYFQRAAETGDTSAFREAAHLLEEAGRTDEMVRLRQYGIEPGGRIADRWRCERSK